MRIDRRTPIIAVMCIIFLLIMLLSSSVIAATLLKYYPCTVNIVYGDKDIEAYSDPAMTIPLTSIDFGDVMVGEEAIAYFYLKNTGQAPLSITLQTEDISPWATVVFGPTSPFDLGIGTGASCNIRLTIKSVAAEGPAEFNIHIMEGE